jgi:signal transduction histidine kinase
MAEIAYRNSERLTRLINDILDLDKIESGKMPFDPQPVDLRQAIEEALEDNQPYAEQQGVALVLEPGAQDVQVYADPDRLQQVLANLLSNAIKFSPSGESVEARVRPAADRIRVEVADRGSGIPEEFRDRIFQKFTQADSARSKGGTGLGLSIAKAIVERSGGYLSFESAVGRGTTFYFELPRWSERLTA